MDGFKKIVKMKIGGVVKPAAYVTRKELKQEESKDISADKQMVKKGVSQHESFLHKGEPKTELTLKKGGRAKKAVGTVSKYKTGGSVAYEAKKDSGDLSKIQKIKDTVPAKAATPSGAKGGPNKYKCGGGIKKMAVGGSTLQDLMQAKEIARLANAKKYLGKGQQGQFAGQEMQQTPAQTGLPVAPAIAPNTPPAPMPAPVPGSAPPMKKGGKAKKDKC